MIKMVRVEIAPNVMWVNVDYESRASKTYKNKIPKTVAKWCAQAGRKCDIRNVCGRQVTIVT